MQEGSLVAVFSDGLALLTALPRVLRVLIAQAKASYTRAAAMAEVRPYSVLR